MQKMAYDCAMSNGNVRRSDLWRHRVEPVRPLVGIHVLGDAEDSLPIPRSRRLGRGHLGVRFGECRGLVQRTRWRCDGSAGNRIILGQLRSRWASPRGSCGRASIASLMVVTALYSLGQPVLLKP